MDERPKKKARIEPDPVAQEIRNLVTPILSEEEVRDCDLVPAFFAEIVNPRDINAIVKGTPQDPQIHHLKRLNRVPPSTSTFILLGLVPESGVLPEPLRILCENHQLEVQKTQVPKHACCSEDQVKSWSIYWPSSIKTIIPSTPNANFFKDDQILQIKYFMEMAWRESQIALAEGNRPVGCVLVSPQGKQWTILGTGRDSSSSHMLDHAAFNCINSIAKIQVAEIQRNPAKDNGDYLCTGCYFFTTQEPCIMCSMALVHSRIGAIFFHSPNPQHGGIGSRFKVHCHKALNHHFMAYKCSFPLGISNNQETNSCK